MNGISLNADSNYFQKYLVPAKSYFVRLTLQKAGELGKSENVFFSRFLTIVVAITAIVFSILNTFSYLLQIPIKIILNVIRFRPVQLIFDIIKDLSNTLRSFLFVSFGVTFIVAGILFPAFVFPYFAPDDIETPFMRLENENKLLLEDNQKKNAKLEDIEVLKEALQTKIDQLEILQKKN